MKKGSEVNHIMPDPLRNFQKLSVLYLHNQRLMSGKAHDIVIMRTCHAVAKLGHTVAIITGKPSGKESLSDYYGLPPLPDFNIIQTPMLRGKHLSWHGIFNMFCLLKILELKRKGLAQVIYLREIKLARFLLRFKHIIGLPFVIEIHDLKIKKFYDNLPEKDDDEEWVFKRVDAIVVLLDSFGNILKEVYNIINTPVVKVPLAAERLSFREKTGSVRKVGYIGQLYPLQGVDILVESMPYLPDARLSIIGGSEKDLKRLKSLADALNVSGRIDFHGFVNPHRVLQLAGDMDVMVICALDEGKRRYAAHTKLYEYMAMGKPVVAADLPSVSEEVTDGVDVLLAGPGDPRSFAEKIEYIFNNPEKAQSLAANAYRTAGGFTWEKRAERLAEVFRTVQLKDCYVK